MSPHEASNEGEPSPADRRLGRPRPTRVVVTSTVALNGGDAAILAGQCETLERAFGSVELVVFDQQADVARRYYPAIEFRPALFWMRGGGSGPGRRARWAARLVRLFAAAVALRAGSRRTARVLCPTGEDLRDLETYQSADVVSTNGGTMLVEHYQFLPRLVDYAAVLVLGRPLVFFTQSLGPFTRRFRARAVAAFLRRSRLVLVRGERSRSYTADLGVPADLVRLVPDAAFLLADENLRARSPSERSEELKVAISMRDWPFFGEGSKEDGQARYERAIADLCTWFVREKGAEVTCVSTCQGIPKYWADDSRTATRMAEGLAADVRERVRIDTSFRPPHALRDHLAAYDLVVATRLHAAILAMTAGTPVVAIEYEQKAHEVFDGMGLDEWVLDIDDVEGPGLIGVVDRLLAQIGPVTETVVEQVGRHRRLALAGADYLAQAIDSI